MPSILVLTLIGAASIALWLGLSLWVRDPRDPRLASCGLGLIGYAAAVAGLALLVGTDSDAPAGIERFWLSARYIPAVFWIATLLSLTRGEAEARWSGAVFTGAWPGLIALILVLSGAALLYPESATLGIAVELCLAASLLLVFRGRGRWRGNAGTFGLVGLASLFFALGITPLLVSGTGESILGIPMPWLAVGLAGDLLILGLAVAALDAFEQGESFGIDLLRSFSASMGLSLLLGGQVLAAMAFGAGRDLPMLGLLIGSVFSAITLIALAPQAQGILDRLVFVGRPEIVAERERLQAVAVAIPRRPAAQGSEGEAALGVLGWDEDTCVRHTRNALSHYGNLSRLATSPLMTLPEIDRRLGDRGSRADTLDRANELKRLLAESVERLRPAGEARFGDSDEWRHYNVLYFPYILGLKPFSRRLQQQRPDSEASDALNWFRDQVPERTYYNWQRAAAALVARDLQDLHQAHTAE